MPDAARGSHPRTPELTAPFGTQNDHDDAGWSAGRRAHRSPGERALVGRAHRRHRRQRPVRFAAMPSSSTGPKAGRFDQRSANGTWLDNAHRAGALQSGQQLRLGAEASIVQVPGAAMPRGPGTMAPQPAVSPYGQPAYPRRPPPQPGHRRPRPRPLPAARARLSAAGRALSGAVAPSGAVALSGRRAPATRPYLAQAGGAGRAAPGAGAPPPRPAAQPPAGGGMTEAEAAEILGLWPGSPGRR
jgi:hypothetical protein